MISFSITKPGFKPAYQPNLKFVNFFYIDHSKVPYRVRQKYRAIEYHIIKIREYSCSDIRLVIDSDFSTLIDFINNCCLFTHENTESSAALIFLLEQVQQFYRYDRYPESISTMSQYNHYQSLKQKFYGKKK